jgi:hypothetical protein
LSHYVGEIRIAKIYKNQYCVEKIEANPIKFTIISENIIKILGFVDKKYIFYPVFDKKRKYNDYVIANICLKFSRVFVFLDFVQIITG